MFKSKSTIFACFTALALSSACSDSKSQGTGTNVFTLADSIPSDTTGKTGTVSLNVASSVAAALNLLATDAAAPTTRAIGSNIELTYAKFNIAKIRVKATKDQSADEKTLESMENDEEKSSAKEVEVETGDDDATLTASNKTPKEHKDDKAAKIKAKASKLKEGEAAHIEKEVARDKSNKFVGPYVYDAIAGKIEGTAPTVNLADGSYHRVEFQLKRNFSAAEGEAILGNVFAIKGTFLKAGVKVPFEIDWHIALNFRLAGDSAITVTGGANNAMVISFDLNKWFEGVDLTTATVDADGTIYIDKNTNKEIMKEIHHNIKLNARVGKDLDNNKTLNGTEAAATAEDAPDATVE
ncbi:MAG: hypothetical protein H7249_05820 [Chitinophagaceae bacterium]|nr:hypothetical protein [Oligoflexus sp.]